MGDIQKSSLKVGDKVELLRRNSELVVAPLLTVTSIDATAKSVGVDGTLGTLDPLCSMTSEDYKIKSNLLLFQ